MGTARNSVPIGLRVPASIAEQINQVEDKSKYLRRLIYNDLKNQNSELKKLVKLEKAIEEMKIKSQIINSTKFYDSLKSKAKSMTERHIITSGLNNILDAQAEISEDEDTQTLIKMARERMKRNSRTHNE